MARLNLAQKFTLASFVISTVGTIVIAWWVGYQIELRSVHEFGHSSAIHAHSLIEPHLVELGRTKTLSPDEARDIDAALEIMRRGHPIMELRIWDASGRVVYSSLSLQAGRTDPLPDGLARAGQGEVVSSIRDLQDLHNEGEPRSDTRRVVTYFPVRASDSSLILAVAEVQEEVNHLLAEISKARLESGLFISAGMLVIYSLLLHFARRANKKIARQNLKLQVRLTELAMLMNQNEALNAQVRRAAASVVAINEQFLRRIGAELHDGVAQELSVALLRVDRAVALCESCVAAGLERGSNLQELAAIQHTLQEGLQEARSLAAGLVLPRLDDLTLAETLADVVRAHERRTGTRVALSMHGLPKQVAVPAQVAIYRFVQEGLRNAFRHAEGIGQQVQAHVDDGNLIVEVSDQGGGFDPAQAPDGGEHLGLIGMRERVESLGGSFCVETSPGQGTRIAARLPLAFETSEEG